MGGTGKTESGKRGRMGLEKRKTKTAHLEFKINDSSEHF